MMLRIVEEWWEVFECRRRMWCNSGEASTFFI